METGREEGRKEKERKKRIGEMKAEEEQIILSRRQDERR